MHANHARNDELKPRKPYAIVGNALKPEGQFGIADIHADLDRGFGMLSSARSLTSTSSFP